MVSGLFHPKMSTPGCTIQGKIFHRQQGRLRRRWNFSRRCQPDDVVSHKNFTSKFGFNIDLLADTNAQLLKACGIGQSDYKGTMYWDRTSIVVDPKGTVRKVYEKVDPNGHEQTLLQTSTNAGIR